MGQIRVTAGITNTLVAYGLSFDETLLWAGVNLKMVRDYI